MEKKLCILVCETFRREAEVVATAEDFDDTVITFFPERCGIRSSGPIEQEPIPPSPEEYDRIETMGGACMKPASVVRGQRSSRSGNATPDQCFHLVADRKFVDTKQAEGSYLITPGWLEHWQQRIEDWGFDSDTAKSFFRESCERLLLLDTGVMDNAPEALTDFARFVDRPYGIHHVGTGYLALAMTRIVADWRKTRETSNTAAGRKKKNRQLADYALLLEMIGTLTQTQVESEVITQIVEIFTMLFGSNRVVYLPIVQGVSGSPRIVPPSGAGETVTIDRFLRLDEDYAWSNSGEGFVLRIRHDREIVAVVEVDNISYPEYLEHYLNLALGIVSVCGLAIANARKVERITANLKEKERLLQEIHHRVKNNMMAISGLLNLSMMNTDSEAARAVLQDSQIRIQTISLIHESLYRSDTLSSIDMREYLTRLANAVFDGFGSPGNVDLVVAVDDVSLEVKQGTPIGLVVNELITNCLKYAFPGRERGEIVLSFVATEDDQIRLSIRDTGVGISPEALQQNSKSFGLVLVRGIVEDQLNGTIEVRNNNGTETIVTFKGNPETE